MNALPKRTAALAGACALALSGALLAGCSSSNTDQEILDKLNRMETEIAELKGAQASDGGQTGSAAADSTVAGQDAVANPSDAADTDLEAAIVDLETRSISAFQAALATAVPSAIADRPQAYVDAKAPLESLEHEADLLEDQVEAHYRQGTIDQSTFWSYDKRLSEVERSLDEASDNLERRMGVDD